MVRIGKGGGRGTKSNEREGRSHLTGGGVGLSQSVFV